MAPKISIVMATYNGEKYLSEQIDSIIKQTYTDWELIIRDDGSSDGTTDIILEYVRRYPVKIRFIIDTGNNLGVSQNFIYILSHTKAEYVMFCDQDDIWLQDKINVTLNKMDETEAKYGADMPVLVHTDLKVVDKDLNIISNSFRRYQNLDPFKGANLNRLLVQNTITGATVMVNRALADKIRLLPEHCIIYDWWIGLVAAAFGKIDYVPSATILYRQHRDNVTGAKKWGLFFILKTLIKGRAHIRAGLLRTQLQAESFLSIFKNELEGKDLELLVVYSTIKKRSFFIKRWILVRYRLLKAGFIRNIGLFLNI